jgi:hypothetical protein
VYSRLGKRQMDGEAEPAYDQQHNGQGRNVRQRQQQQSQQPPASSSGAGNPIADQLRYMEELNRVAVQSGFRNAKEMLEMTSGGGAAPMMPPVAAPVMPPVAAYPPAPYHAPYGGGRGGYHHYPGYADPSHGYGAPPPHGYYPPYGGPGGPGGRFPGGRGGRMGRGRGGRGDPADPAAAASATASAVAEPVAEAVVVPASADASGAEAAAAAPAADAAGAEQPAQTAPFGAAPFGGRGGRGPGRGAGRGFPGRFGVGHNPFAQQAQPQDGAAPVADAPSAADASAPFQQQQSWYPGGGRGRGGRFNPHYHAGGYGYPGGGRFPPGPAGGRHANKTWVRPTDADSSLSALR